jgi:MFS family permease
VIEPHIVRRSTVLLAATLTCLSGMLQLVVAVATITLVLVTGIESILGLGPAVFLASAALAALPAGRAMDRRGRVPVLAAGCLCGVALGPLVFRPLLEGKTLDSQSLVIPYLAAGAIMVLGTLIVLQVKPDPSVFAERHHGDAPRAEPAPLAEILRRPGAIVAVVAAVASFSVMVSVMNLSGYVVVGNGHPQADVFTVISAHIVGMYALVLVVGRFVDDMGRRPALIGGLLVEAVSAAGIGWAHSVAASCVCLFGLGIGWNVAFVAAAAELTDIALPAERGKLLGFTDLASGLTGAGFALAGGVIYSQMGAIALGVGAMLIAAVPAAWFTVTAVRRPLPAA